MLFSEPMSVVHFVMVRVAVLMLINTPQNSDIVIRLVFCQVSVIC